LDHQELCLRFRDPKPEYEYQLGNESFLEPLWFEQIAKTLILS